MSLVIKEAFFDGKPMKNELKIVYMNTDLLKPADYNPGKWDKVAISNRSESIKKFGLVDPIIANSASNR